MKPAPASSDADERAFFEHVKTKGKPALAALIRNAFRLERNGAQLTFYMDKSVANLIPMLRNKIHFNALQAMVKDFFALPLEIHFKVGSDPKLKQQIKREEEALEIVKSNDAVRFIMERFEGSIINCGPLKPTKE